MIGMGEIFSRRVGVKNLITIGHEIAKAIEDPIRIAILEILSTKSCSIVEIAEELEKTGVKKSPNAIRHHVDILKKAGLIELTRLEDVRGGVLKYYASNTRVLHQSMPEGFDESMSEAIEDARREIERIIQKIGEKYGNEILETARSLKHCPYCSDEHFTEYVVVQILSRAIARLSGEGRITAVLKGVERLDGRGGSQNPQTPR